MLVAAVDDDEEEVGVAEDVGAADDDELADELAARLDDVSVRADASDGSTGRSLLELVAAEDEAESLMIDDDIEVEVGRTDDDEFAEMTADEVAVGSAVEDALAADHELRAAASSDERLAWATAQSGSSGLKQTTGRRVMGRSARSTSSTRRRAKAASPSPAAMGRAWASC